tara:strand:+ start:244 stop:1386 length:1143 start_codon:yes stop_codon:yes gene_type:complete
MSHSSLNKAKKKKNDEFYTQYNDIEFEISAYLEYNPNLFQNKTILLPCDDPEWSNFTKYFSQNFERFGLKKLISTSYALNSKNYKEGHQLSLLEENDNNFDKSKTSKNGKIFILSKDINKDGTINIEDLEWSYLEGDGDFRSAEVSKLRDEADIIITNPPFSIFREYLAWVTAKKKLFLLIANKGAATYKEVFPLIMDNKMWSGKTKWSGGLWFETKDKSDVDEVREGVDMKNVPAVWFTNIEHGRRHEPISLMSLKDNLRFSKHKEIKGKKSYDKYCNYDAIEVPFYDAIPSDYEGVMGVPVTFLDKYCPEQFQIVGMCENEDLYNLKTKIYNKIECKKAYMDKFGKEGVYDLNASGVILKNGILEKVYSRILIRSICS